MDPYPSKMGDKVSFLPTHPIHLSIIKALPPQEHGAFDHPVETATNRTYLLPLRRLGRLEVGVHDQEVQCLRLSVAVLVLVFEAEQHRQGHLSQKQGMILLRSSREASSEREITTQERQMHGIDRMNCVCTYNLTKLHTTRTAEA